MGAHRLLIRIVLMAAIIASTFAVTMWIPAPAGNSYLMAILDKERRLAQLPPGKMVLVGGSNLAFGIDSSLLESKLGRPVANMGLGAGLGLPFMLREVKPYVERGDVIVLTPEYDLFDSSRIPNHALCVAAFYLPQPWRRIGLSDYVRCGVMKTITAARRNAKWAALRLTGRPEKRRLGKRPERGLFNTRGDYEGHLSEKALFAADRRKIRDVLQGNEEPSGEAVDALVDFSRFARRAGARVVLFYPPYPRSYYVSQRRVLARIDAVLRRRLVALVTFLSRPEDAVMPDEMFYDTQYHLTARGRALRSARMAEALAPLVRH